MKKQKKHFLESLRFDYGLSQGQLAEILNVSQAHISRIEHGLKEIDWNLKNTLSETFGIDMDDYLGERFVWSNKVLLSKEKLILL